MAPAVRERASNGTSKQPILPAIPLAFRGPRPTDVKTNGKAQLQKEHRGRGEKVESTTSSEVGRNSVTEEQVPAATARPEVFGSAIGQTGTDLHAPRAGRKSIVFGGIVDSPRTSPPPTLGVASPPPGALPSYTIASSTSSPSVRKAEEAPSVTSFTSSRPASPVQQPDIPQKTNHSRRNSTTVPPEMRVYGKATPLERDSRNVYHSDNEGHAPEDYISSGLLLSRHMLMQFGRPDFADYVLHIEHANDLFPPASIPVHGINVARSPSLFSLMNTINNHPNGNMNSPNVLQVTFTDRFVTTFAFFEVLRHLYGAPLLCSSAPIQLPPNTLEPEIFADIQRRRMRHALAYVASGHFLNLDLVIVHGLEVAEKLLSWDTLELALNFALDGGLDASWMMKDEASMQTNGVSNNDSHHSRVHSAPLAQPTFGIFSTQFLHQILLYLVHSLPPTFALDLKAAQLRESPRLPPSAEPRPSVSSISNPRLRQIRFGQLPVEEEPLLSPTNTLISSILISLPFPVLKFLLEHPVLHVRQEAEQKTSILHALVHEREERRLKVVTSRNDDVALHAKFSANLEWEESIADTSSGARLVRFHKPLTTPATPSAT